MKPRLNNKLNFSLLSNQFTKSSMNNIDYPIKNHDESEERLQQNLQLNNGQTGNRQMNIVQESPNYQVNCGNFNTISDWTNNINISSKLKIRQNLNKTNVKDEYPGSLDQRKFSE